MEDMIKEEVIIEKEVVIEKAPKYKEKECEVVSSFEDSFGQFSIIDFNGFGLSVPKTENSKIIVKYVGTIGSADFKIIE